MNQLGKIFYAEENQNSGVKHAVLACIQCLFPVTISCDTPKRTEFYEISKELGILFFLRSWCWINIISFAKFPSSQILYTIVRVCWNGKSFRMQTHDTNSTDWLIYTYIWGKNKRSKVKIETSNRMSNKS